MITTDDDRLASFARTYRNHGVPEGTSRHEILGHNCRMDELRATLGISQVRRIEEFLSHRETIAQSYVRGLGSLCGQGNEFVQPPAGMRHSRYKFPLLLPSSEKRDALARSLKEKYGIETGTVFTGGTAGAAGTSGVNASAEGAGGKTAIFDDAFNVLNGWLWVPTPRESIVMPAGSASGFGLFLPTAPATLTGWTFGDNYAEV